MRRMARTAAVVGTTKHVVEGNEAKKDAAAAAAQPPAPVAAAPAPAPAEPAGITEDKMAQLERLGKMNADGILTDAEFADEKAKILAG